MKTLSMIRHSITKANERRLYYGSTDLPLSESGRDLCRTMHRSFELADDMIFATSGMLRTEETLQLIFGDVPHEILPELREMDFGEFEMHAYDELKDNPSYQAWLSDASGTFRIHGGESNMQVAERVTRCIDTHINRRHGSLIIVRHSGIIAHVMVHCFPNSGKSYYDWIPAACRGYAIEFEDGRPSSYRSI